MLLELLATNRTGWKTVSRKEFISFTSDTELCQEEEYYYVTRQEELTKNDEQAFEVLKDKFHILDVPCKLQSRSSIEEIV